MVIYLNAFLDGTFNARIIMEYGSGIFDDSSDLCYFFYQFLDYFQINPVFNNETVPIHDYIVFIKFISDNFMIFDHNIWTFVFNSYEKELTDIFHKAPLTQERIVLLKRILQNQFLLFERPQDTLIKMCTIMKHHMEQKESNYVL